MMIATTPALGSYRSKTFATWIAFLGGALGLHRFYLHGLRDSAGWLFPVPTLIGLYGVQRMRRFGIDDQTAWLLIPVLGAVLSIVTLTAIVYGLTPDDKWNARYNPSGPQHRTGWSTIIGVMAALVIGAGVLMATIAFCAQHYFEYNAPA